MRNFQRVQPFQKSIGLYRIASTLIRMDTDTVHAVDEKQGPVHHPQKSCDVMGSVGYLQVEGSNKEMSPAQGHDVQKVVAHIGWLAPASPRGAHI